MKPLFIFLFILGANGLFAQQTEGRWYPGKVTLKDGTELMGDVNYNLSNQTAKVRVNGKITTLREKQLTNLIIFIGKLWHEFQYVALKNEQGEVSFTFARLIYRSPKKYSLYKEYYAVGEDFSINPATGMPALKEPPAELDKDIFMPNPKLGVSMDYRLFLVNSEGESHSITSKGLSEAYGQCFKRIKNFITRNRLTVKKEANVARIIRYADYLGKGCSDD